MASPNPPSPSGAMLQAALGGLLCFAACGDPDASGSGGSAPSGGATASSGAATGAAVTSSGSGGTSPNGTGGSANGSGGAGGEGEGAAPGSGGATGSSTTASSSGATASSSTGANPHTPIPNTACGDGQVENPEVTSTVVVVLSQDDFLGICAQAGGIFEIQPLCGGSNACRGIAYDSGTHVLTHHTCQATNTCAGYNCVVCDG